MIQKITTCVRFHLQMNSKRSVESLLLLLYKKEDDVHELMFGSGELSWQTDSRTCYSYTVWLSAGASWDKVPELFFTHGLSSMM